MGYDGDAGGKKGDLAKTIFYGGPSDSLSTAVKVPHKPTQLFKTSTDSHSYSDYIGATMKKLTKLRRCVSWVVSFGIVNSSPIMHTYRKYYSPTGRYPCP